MARIPNFYRGDTLTYTLNFKDKNGNAIDVSNNTIWFTLKSSIGDSDADAALQHSITFPNDAVSQAGTGVLVVPASKTATLNIAPYYYGIQWVRDTDNITTLQTGRLSVLQDVTITTV